MKSKKIKDKFFSHLYIFIFIIISIFISIIVCILKCKDIITNGSELLPHVITFSTIVLGLVSLVFTIIISIRDRSFYRLVKEKQPRILNQLFGCLTASVYASLLLVIFSMVALVISHSNDILKYSLVFIISGSFFFLLLTTIQMFKLSVEMLKLDDKELQ